MDAATCETNVWFTCSNPPSCPGWCLHRPNIAVNYAGANITVRGWLRDYPYTSAGTYIFSLWSKPLNAPSGAWGQIGLSSPIQIFDQGDDAYFFIDGTLPLIYSNLQPIEFQVRVHNNIIGQMFTCTNYDNDDSIYCDSCIDGSYTSQCTTTTSTSTTTTIPSITSCDELCVWIWQSDPLPMPPAWTGGECVPYFDWGNLSSSEQQDFQTDCDGWGNVISWPGGCMGEHTSPSTGISCCQGRGFNSVYGSNYTDCGNCGNFCRGPGGGPGNMDYCQGQFGPNNLQCHDTPTSNCEVCPAQYTIYVNTYRPYNLDCAPNEVCCCRITTCDFPYDSDQDCRISNAEWAEAADDFNHQNNHFSDPTWSTARMACVNVWHAQSLYIEGQQEDHFYYNPFCYPFEDWRQLGTCCSSSVGGGVWDASQYLGGGCTNFDSYNYTQCTP
ncbi:hypothetical protein ACFLRC_03775 [Candidatus Altiarchaeota archaeon]